VLLPIGGCPHWSPDGGHIAFDLNGIQVIDIYTGEVITLLPNDFIFGRNSLYNNPISWSPDANHLLYRHSGWEVYSLSILNLPSMALYFGDSVDWWAWSHDGKGLYLAQHVENCYLGSLPGLQYIDLARGSSMSLAAAVEDQPGEIEYFLAPFQPQDQTLYYFLGTRNGQVCADPLNSPPGYRMTRSSSDAKTGRRTLNPTLVTPAEVLWAPDGSLALVGGGASSETLYLLRVAGQTAVYLPVSGWSLHWAR
jgi:hypothetical protein